MKVAITVQGTDLDSPMDQRFGRAGYLLVVDSGTEQYQTHDNTIHVNAASGAGIQTAQNVANLDVEAVITGNVGPNAIRTLNAAKIKVYLTQATTAREALDLFNAGQLVSVSEASVEGHWA